MQSKREQFFAEHPAARPLMDELEARDLLISVMQRVGERQAEHAERLVCRHVDDVMRFKFMVAERIWSIRNERMYGLTWSEWFRELFSEPLEEYADRAQREGIREKLDGVGR